MLDIKFIRDNAALVKENVKRRGYDLDIDALLSADAERRKLTTQLDALRQESNELAKDAKATGKPSPEKRQRAIEIKQEIAARQERLRAAEQRYWELLIRVPNMLDPRVPLGDEDAFTVVREWGGIPQFDFAPRPHDELMEELNMLNIEQGIRLAGSRFYVLKNAAVKLRYAMTQLFVNSVAGAQWELVSPPLLAGDKTLFTAGYLPFAEKDNYRIAGEDLSLIGTSEQAILGLHMDEILDRLPLLYLGDSLCFRTEAGSAGRDTKGIIRVHQFFKLEQIVYCLPQEVETWHRQCLKNEELFLQLLGIPYRVIICASGDMGAPGYFKYDVEAWMPSQNRYREVTSNTNLTDYQTRRGNIRFRTEDGARVFPYTISATGFCDRHLLALIENCQTQEGTIRIPDALAPYMGGLAEIRNRR